MYGRNIRKKQIITIGIVIVAILTISIGFAVFSNTLTVSSNAIVTPDPSGFAVIFSSDGSSTSTTQSVTPNSTTLGETATITNESTPTITGLKANFTSPGQSVTYSFYVKNIGNYLAYLNSITYKGSKSCTAGSGATDTLVQAACDDIKIKVKIGTITAEATKLNITGETLSAGTNRAIKVKIEYLSGGDRSDGPFNVTFGDISLYYSSVTGQNEEYVAGYTGVIYRNSTETIAIGDEIDPLTYETNVANISQNYYLKHEVVNNVVTASYACITYTEDGTRKDVCLRGGDSSYYESNKAIIQGIENYFNAYGGFCSFDDSHSDCTSDSLSLDADSGGTVVASNGRSLCDVIDGISRCT